jgi:hypothetical protein
LHLLICRFQKVKSVLKTKTKKIKKTLPPSGTAGVALPRPGAGTRLLSPRPTAAEI